MTPATNTTHRSRPKRSVVQDGRSAWERYEQIKRDLTATIRTSAEYDAACRRAAKRAGV